MPCCGQCVDMQGGVRRAVYDKTRAELFYITKEEEEAGTVMMMTHQRPTCCH